MLSLILGDLNRPTTYLYLSYLPNDASDYATDYLGKVSNNAYAINISSRPKI